MSERDDLGNRMKHQYEDRTRYLLPRRTWTIIRVDGKAFHTFTEGLQRPYDYSLVKALNGATVELLSKSQGSLLAYLQSDEISIVLQDFKRITTDAWFDGNVQKIASVSASIFTGYFNKLFKHPSDSIGIFDARVFTIPDPVEVENYLIWRQQDAIRNSIQSLGRKHFSYKEVEGLSCSQIQEKLFCTHSINWNGEPTTFKRGRAIYKYKDIYYVDDNIPVFTQDRNFLKSLLNVVDEVENA